MLNYNVREACKIIGISRGLLYKLIKLNKGPPITKIGRRTFFQSDSFTTWLKKLEKTSIYEE